MSESGQMRMASYGAIPMGQTESEQSTREALAGPLRVELLRALKGIIDS